VATKPTIAIIGPGRLGSALIRGLAQAGYSVSEVISRDNAASRRNGRRLAQSVHAQTATTKTTNYDAGLIWLCVPDREIAGLGRELDAVTRWTEKQWKTKLVFHSSGALSSDELNVLRKKGAAVASVHPLMTFVRGSIPSLQGVPFAVEGDAAAVRLAREVVKALGGTVFALRKKDKAAYHAWATFCSPLLIAALVTAEQVGRTAGFSVQEARRKMLPIVQQTIANYAALGPAAAFSGPIVRGDANVVRQHLRVLKSIPAAKETYVALARSALRHLPSRERKQLAKILDAKPR
jgi:predicted short-subunit dehydrogenase-like oxidoreductase (DUF2520 family)